MAVTTTPGVVGRSRDVDASAIPRLVSGLVTRPRLFALLDRAGPVTLLCGPAGSGKTTLLSSWLRGAELPGRGARGSASSATCPMPRGSWSAVMDALRGSGAIAGDDPLATLTNPHPWQGTTSSSARCSTGSGGCSLTRLSGPGRSPPPAARGRRWTVWSILLARAPAQLRTFVVSRRDPRLGLHRLRLAGELTEIRAVDLGVHRRGEAGELMAAAGIAVEAADLGRLRERTEGWAAGLRLAAMSLARHPRAGSLRGRVLGQRAHRGGLPARRGAHPAAAGAARVAVAHLDPGAGQRPTCRSSSPARERRHADAARAGGGERARRGRRCGAGRGFAITTCWAICCAWSCGARRRLEIPTAAPARRPRGTRSTAIRWRRSGTRSSR